jgi:hypothetical protein
MVQSFIVRVSFVALAVFAGACASKKANWEVPSQPEPASTSNADDAEKARREKVSKEAERDEKKDGLEQEIRDTRETAKERRERQAKAKEGELERLVYVPTQEEREILARAAEIEAKKATAAAQKAKEVGDSPAIRQARRDHAKEERRNKKASEQRAKMIVSSRLVGCDADTVAIFPLDQGFDPFAIFPSTLRIRIVNTSPVPIDIETPFRGYGPLIRNLCPGGSVNVTFKLGSTEESQLVPMTAISMTPDGVPMTQERQFFIQKNLRTQNIRNEIWNVILYTR